MDALQAVENLVHMQIASCEMHFETITYLGRHPSRKKQSLLQTLDVIEASIVAEVEETNEEILAESADMRQLFVAAKDELPGHPFADHIARAAREVHQDNVAKLGQAELVVQGELRSRVGTLRTKVKFVLERIDRLCRRLAFNRPRQWWGLVFIFVQEFEHVQGVCGT
jgi:hypothetical protein